MVRYMKKAIDCPTYGFYSNKDWTSIVEHSHSSSVGGSFVSTTIAAGNKALFKVEPVMNSARQLLDSEIPPSLEKAIESHEFTGQKFVLRVYEYEVTNIEGTTPKENAKVAKELEVVTPYIPMSSISRVREVTYVLDRQWNSNFSQEIKRELVASEFGDWISLTKPGIE